MPAIADKTIERLSLYRRALTELQLRNEKHVFSHQLAAAANVTAAQVRRDIMATGYTGSPVRGYNTGQLIESIGVVLDHPEGQKVALIGVGNLGRAILAFFAGRHTRLHIVAAFDGDPALAGRIIHGCRCYSMEELEAVVTSQNIRVAILCTPPEAAREMSAALAKSGVRGVLNFSQKALRMPSDVYVENTDMTMLLEKVAYFARQSGAK